MARQGDWMQTATGRQFWPLDPHPDEIDIEDIARALSHQCRFAGHTRAFYSVAQHSVHVSEACDPNDALWGLLHDASEAYLVDIPRPIKRQPFMEQYREYEHLLMEAIAQAFGLPWHNYFNTVFMPESVKRADEVLLATEARDLMGNHCLERWSSIRDVNPLPLAIRCWSSDHAYRAFLARYDELTGFTRPRAALRNGTTSPAAMAP